MANIVSHVVTVTGPPEAVRAFKDRMIGRACGLSLDFAALVPMPESLARTGSSSMASDGLILLGRDDLPDPLISTSTVGDQARRMLDYPWVREAGVSDRAGLMALIERRAATDGGVKRRLALGRAAIAAFDETGHVSAASWANKHWGCTGARHFELVKDEPGRLEFTFGTAWSSPEPIWEQIAVTFPDVVVDVVGFEEAWQFGLEGKISGGRNGIKDVDPTPELYERVYGQPYEEEEDAEAPGPSQHPDHERPAAGPDARPSRGQAINWDLVGWIIAGVGLAIYLLWSWATAA